MKYAAPLFLCMVLLSSLALAEKPGGEDERLVELRNSATYQKGLTVAREKFDMAYDMGAVRGASRWEVLHQYYVELARADGCKKGFPYADGPVEICHKVSGSEPKLLAKEYHDGKREIVRHSKQTLYPDLVKKVLSVIYDYGYVQGMKHGLRRYNDDLLWMQTYLQSCVSRANDAQHEPLCAESAKAWSAGHLEGLSKELGAHGLPAGKKPK